MTANIDVRSSAVAPETVTGAGATAARSGVLVVEASPLVLPAVREAVAGLPGSWTVYGAAGPQEAAKVLLAEPIDIAMVAIPPSLGAVAFLEWLRRRYPQVTRLAAFATRSSDEAIQASNVAHQSLGQIPRRSEHERVMSRSVTLRRRLESDQLTRFAGGLQRIPTIPTVYHEIRSLLVSPDYSLSALADLIARDAGLSVKILQVINSAYYGLRRRISDLRQAVGLLGGSAIASLILGMTVHEQFVIRSSAKDAIAPPGGVVFR